MNDENKIELLMHSKHLVHTSYEVTAIQNRIFYHCLLNAQKSKNGNLKCTISLQDLKEMIPNKTQKTLNGVKKILDVLSKSTLEFEGQDNKSGEKAECLITLIAMRKYFPKSEMFEITFLEELYDHIINYTVYAPLNLMVMSKFKSFYSQRLYELLRLWSRKDKEITKEFKVDQLKFIFGVEKKYPNYKNFKQRVLAQAMKEINNVGNMNIEMEEIKKGRMVESIRFIIVDRGERKLSDLKSIKNDVLLTNSDDIIVEDMVQQEIEIMTDNSFYVPNKKLFTKKTLELFEQDFGEYDFKDKNNQSKFYESTGIAMAKDGENKIKMKNYNLFKTILIDKFSERQNIEKNVQDIEFKKTKFHNFNENFTQYTSEELDDIIEKSQKEKFGK